MWEREIIHALLCSKGACPSRRRISPRFHKRLFKSAVISRRHEQTRFSLRNERPMESRISSNNGRPDCHRLNKSVGEPFVAGIQHENISCLHPAERFNTRESRGNERTPVRMHLGNAFNCLKPLPRDAPAGRYDKEFSVFLLKGWYLRRKRNSITNNRNIFFRDTPLYDNVLQIRTRHNSPRCGGRNAGLNFLQSAYEEGFLRSLHEIVEFLLNAKPLYALLPRVVAHNLHNKGLPCLLCRLHRRQADRDGVKGEHGAPPACCP